MWGHRSFKHSEIQGVNVGYMMVGPEEVKEIGTNEGKDENQITSEDPFALVDVYKPSGKPWKELDTCGKIKSVATAVSRVTCLIGLLYLFICSLGFLSDAFKLLGGKAAGQIFSSDTVLGNPIAGLMIGILGTVLLQSSSTTTSIVVAMVASGIIKVRPAIPLIMGANIGTSVTNTIVSLTQITEKDHFRRAFAGATVHDMFNILSVLVFLPLELITGYLYYMTDAIVESMSLKKGDKVYKKELLKKITKPFTNLFVQLDKKVIFAISQGDEKGMETSLVKFYCDKGRKETSLQNVTNIINGTVELKNVTETKYFVPCKFLLHGTGMSDSAVGIIMLVIALAVLCICLVMIVKLLHSLLKGRIAVVIRKSFNSDFPKPFGFLTGYVAILLGAGFTILVQSSSIFTSALTPLVGMGVVSVERMYPLTLGSNIGTTATSILAALASSGDKFAYALQISFCHLFFNISGIVLWYPIPKLRRFPIRLAKFLGNTTAEYRWFAITYLIFWFGIVPALIFALSLGGWKVFTGVIVPIVVFILSLIVINLLQNRKPTWLPKRLRSWSWVPLWMRSLKPLDDFFSKCCCRNKCMLKKENRNGVGDISTTQI